MKIVAAMFCLLVLGACTGIPKNIEPVDNFELEQYLGKWYEIARLDHRFERGLSKVSAEYTLKKNGGVVVTNRGFKEKTGEWEDAIGKAYFVGEPNVGHLKLSFFGPFYGSYVVFNLDKEGYQHAFVAGNNTKYLWLLSRTPTVGDDIKEQFLTQASAAGFDTDALIWVEQ